MKPVYFEGVNCVYKAEGCGNLPVKKTENRIISCWEMDENEKEEFLKSGKIYVITAGNIQPPIGICTDIPCTCENCVHCMYIGDGTMCCDASETLELVYDEFYQDKSYMWCKGEKFEER